MADDVHEKITEEVVALTEEQLRAEAINILKDAEMKLGRLGDLMHELRQQMAKIRERYEATP